MSRARWSWLLLVIAFSPLAQAEEPPRPLLFMTDFGLRDDSVAIA